MTVDDIEVLLKDTEHNGYPVVVSRENQYLVGFILRKDLNLAIGELREISRVFHDNEIIYQQPTENDPSRASPVNLW